MTNDQFKALVLRLEDEARGDPSGYQRRVLLLALLGNAYLAGMVVLIAALFFGALASIAVLKAVGVKLAIVIGVFLWMVLRALWIKMPLPEGRSIAESDAPELFAMIDELQGRLRAPRFHDVLVTNDFNAGVVQVPRLGIAGGHRNYLLIGLPLLKSLTVEQVKAVLAHEFGHLARGHGRLSNWIYRQRLRWMRLIAALDASASSGKVLFGPFLKWYAPYFNAYSFPLARANEYEADATSVRLTSPAAAAQALTSVNVIGSYLAERYWPQIHKQANDLRPNFAPYAELTGRVAAELDEASAQGWIQQALSRQTTLDDTHPALTERLKAIGESPSFAPPAPGQGADRLLGRALASVTEAFDRKWHDSVLPAWQERHRQVQEGRRRLEELNARYASGAELSVEDAGERAFLTESVGEDVEGALEQFRLLHRRAPQHSGACFSLGVRLIARNDESGIALLEQAGQLDEGIGPQCAQLLRDYYARHGRGEEAGTWHRRLLESAQRQRAAEVERSRIMLNDAFEPHNLPGDALARLRAQLQAIPDLRAAYLVRRRVPHRPDRDCYVLGFTVKQMFASSRKVSAAQVRRRIRERVQPPGDTVVVNVQGADSRFERKFRRMEGARVC